jgi:IS30 family transposase
LLLRRPAPSPLRTGRDHRRAHTRFTRRRRRFEEPMLRVHQRPFLPEGRSEAGHWEDDVIVRPQHHSAIGMLVERNTRYVKLIHLPRPDSFQLRDGLLRELGGLPAGLPQSITWDQGSEMARHLDITAATGAAVYFCDAGSTWQRGTNENTASISICYGQPANLLLSSSRAKARLGHHVHRFRQTVPTLERATAQTGHSAPIRLPARWDGSVTSECACAPTTVSSRFPTTG